ncbi:MAG: thiamine pyrophosphate-binding protein [Chloroflexi bacterium]|nr:thiamine pyrophosphate-binding protein [Chloroflexota bacterium]
MAGKDVLRGSGAEAVVDVMLREGIDHVFTLSGTEILPILDVVDRNPKMRMILTRHEQGASYMALGFARAARKPSVCMATVGPGAANLIPGVAAALKGSTPMIAITGAHDLWLHEKESNQELDQAALYRPITKWSYLVPSVEKVLEALRKAFRVALSGRPGPVHLAIPAEVQRAETQWEAQEPSDYRAFPVPVFPSELAQQIVHMVNQAQSPLLIVGREVLDEDAIGKVAEVAEALGLPVAVVASNPDAFPLGHPLAVGPLGSGGSAAAKTLVDRADLVLVVGAKLDWFSTNYRPTFFRPGVKIVQISLYPDHMGTVYPMAMGIEASPGAFLTAAAHVAQGADGRQPAADIASLRDAWQAKRASEVDPKAKPVKVAFVVQTIRRMLKQDGILVSDGGNFSFLVRRYFDCYQPHTYYYGQEYGAIGPGLPMAIGVKLARPQQDVVAVCGDGGFMMNVGELETAVRERVKVTVVVCNDSGLTSERAHERVDYPGRFFAVDYGEVDFARIAEGCGALGIRVREPGELEGALERAFSSKLPAVVDVLTDPQDIAERAPSSQNS